MRSPVAALVPLLLQEPLEVLPKLRLLVYIMVPLVAREEHLEHVPLFNVLGHFQIGEGHEVPAHTSKELPLVELAARAPHRHPVLELPVLPRAEDGDHAAPLALAEPVDGVVDIEGNLATVQLLGDLDWLVPISLVDDINAVLEEFLGISEAQATRL